MPAKTESCRGILLCIPPCYSREFPPLGTPSLVAYLNASGIAAFQRDYNLDYLRVSARMLRGKRYLPFDLSRQGNESAALLSERIISSPRAVRYLADSRRNVFCDYFRQRVGPDIRAMRVKAFGISVTSPSQILASFTFGLLAKRAFPGLHVVFGGQWCSLFQEELLKRPDLGACLDTIVVNEGEEPLCELMRSLGEKCPRMQTVPNLIYKQGRRFVRSSVSWTAELDRLPAPDFRGLDLGAYRRKKILTYEMSRGCYWGRCIFCVDLPLPQPLYREKSPGRILADIKELVAAYRPRGLVVSSATMSPAQMESVSRLFIKHRVRLRWETWGRFDPRFTRRSFELARKAGCTTIGFGLESCSQPVLDAIGKGTRLRVIRRILRQAHEAGLSIYAQVMIGLPKETVSQALETVVSLVRLSGYIDSVVFNTYYLTPKNRVFCDPAKYHIRMQGDPACAFRFSFPFEHLHTGMTPAVRSKIIRLYHRLIKAKRKRQGRV